MKLQRERVKTKVGTYCIWLPVRFHLKSLEQACGCLSHAASCRRHSRLPEATLVKGLDPKVDPKLPNLGGGLQPQTQRLGGMLLCITGKLATIHDVTGNPAEIEIRTLQSQHITSSAPCIKRSWTSVAFTNPHRTLPNRCYKPVECQNW